jgi:uncharacterized protein GlcG (DUF336 family)
MVLMRWKHLGALLALMGYGVAAVAQEQLLTRKELPLQVEIEAAHAAIDACAEQHVAVHVYVVDASGEIRLLLIADGAHWDTLSGARRKAYTAARTGEATIDLQKRSAAQGGRDTNPDQKMLLLGGGVPIRADGHLIGALAVGGGAPEQDAVCAQAGLDKIAAYLH